MRYWQRFVKYGLVFACLSTMAGCQGRKQFVRRPVITEENDRQNIASPEFRRISLFEDAIENVFGREIDEYADLSLHVQRLTNNHKQAKNTNALDEVPNSSWFTNRHQQERMSVAELKRGPDQGDGPDFGQEILIVAAKSEGVTPGFRVKDGRGDTYFIKFDSRGYPQLSTAAEVVSTKFVYACGYNTPENYLAVLDPEKLKIREGVTVKNEWGRDIPMTMSFVQELLQKAHQDPDGTYRVVASKRLAGEALGPFLFAGRRKDDPNDRVSHNYRRELRGYYVVAAWLNNSDAKAINTLDMFVTEEGKRFVRHYILDFATSLGSGGYGPAAASRGHYGAFDVAHMFKKLVTLGLYVDPWEKKPRIVSPSVGYFESDLFEPARYAFIVPNPAFQKVTELDGFWGARLVMSFSDEDIRAIVQTGKYENQDDEDHVTKTLIERRDKTGRYWFAKVSPLDNFEVLGDSGRYFIIFRDLAVGAGFESAESSHYLGRFSQAGKPRTAWHEFQRRQAEVPRSLSGNQRETSTGKLQNSRDRIFTLELRTVRGGVQKPEKYVRVHFYLPEDAAKLPEIVALEREN